MYRFYQCFSKVGMVMLFVLTIFFSLVLNLCGGELGLDEF